MAVIAKTHNATRWMRKQCTCEVCRLAASRRQALSHQRRRERLLADPTLRPHGEVNTYQNWGCRCAECSAAHTARNTARRGFSTRLTVPRGPKSMIEPFGREWINA